jgi:hypothetical protein
VKSSDLARARVLLRLYPRAWRERYGDELLELVAETGLTWFVVVDVILSACAQRLRALLAMRRRESERLAEFRRGRSSLLARPCSMSSVSSRWPVAS